MLLNALPPESSLQSLIRSPLTRHPPTTLYQKVPVLWLSVALVSFFSMAALPVMFILCCIKQRTKTATPLSPSCHLQLQRKPVFSAHSKECEPSRETSGGVGGFFPPSKHAATLSPGKPNALAGKAWGSWTPGAKERPSHIHPQRSSGRQFQFQLTHPAPRSSGLQPRPSLSHPVGLLGFPAPCHPF